MALSNYNNTNNNNKNESVDEAPNKTTNSTTNTNTTTVNSNTMSTNYTLEKLLTNLTNPNLIIQKNTVYTLTSQLKEYATVPEILTKATKSKTKVTKSTNTKSLDNNTNLNNLNFLKILKTIYKMIGSERKSTNKIGVKIFEACLEFLNISFSMEVALKNVPNLPNLSNLSNVQNINNDKLNDVKSDKLNDIQSDKLDTTDKLNTNSTELLTNDKYTEDLNKILDNLSEYTSINKNKIINKNKNLNKNINKKYFSRSELDFHQNTSSLNNNNNNSSNTNDNSKRNYDELSKKLKMNPRLHNLKKIISKKDIRLTQSITKSINSKITKNNISKIVNIDTVNSIQSYFDLILEDLQNDLWGRRYGSFIVMSKVIVSNTNKNLTSNTKNNNNYSVSINMYKLLNNTLDILFNDNFFDFVSDRTTAPVIESAASLLSVFFINNTSNTNTNTINNSNNNYKLTKFIENVITKLITKNTPTNKINSKNNSKINSKNVYLDEFEWDNRFSGITLYNKIITNTININSSSNLLLDNFIQLNTVIKSLLTDDNEDVKLIACEVLINLIEFKTNNTINTTTSINNTIINGININELQCIIWNELKSCNELDVSKINFIRLLNTIIILSSNINSNSNNNSISSISSSINFDVLINSLVSPITELRINTLILINNLIKNTNTIKNSNNNIINFISIELQYKLYNILLIIFISDINLNITNSIINSTTINNSNTTNFNSLNILDTITLNLLIQLPFVCNYNKICIPVNKHIDIINIINSNININNSNGNSNNSNLDYISNNNSLEYINNMNIFTPYGIKLNNLYDNLNSRLKYIYYLKLRLKNEFFVDNTIINNSILIDNCINDVNTILTNGLDPINNSIYYLLYKIYFNSVVFNKKYLPTIDNVSVSSKLEIYSNTIK